MSRNDVESILKHADQLLNIAGELPVDAQQAINELLNIVEALSADKNQLIREVERLRRELEKKKKPKTTDQNNSDQDSSDDACTQKDGDHSSEKQRRRRDRKTGQSHDRRTFKKLAVHDEIECPVDPHTLAPDAVRVGNEPVVVQDVQIKPHNIRFLRHVYYSAAERKYFRGPLPPGYDEGDFGADLRALIVSLKYCGKMSEANIGELLENFDVQISSGSLSNILTGTTRFEPEYHDVLVAGLSSTRYQQTDDTSARVVGQAWHTHILCNPFYTWYSTRSGKDRLTVLAVLQNQDAARLRFNDETLKLLREEFTVPDKWHERVAAFVAEHDGDAVFEAAAVQSLLDDWFKGRCRQTRTAIEQAGGIVYYRSQTSVPVIEVLVCDDAGQFKLLTDHLALCWIHAGRHYHRLSPLVPRHMQALADFVERYWDYYATLQDYRAHPSESWAAKLRAAFDELFSTRTGYADLDDRIAKTAGKKEELLTVLSHPSAPLHNNASELGARVSARRRDVSLHSRSVRGARSMDILTTLVETCKKLGLSAYQYFRSHYRRDPLAPSLGRVIQRAADCI
jgi:hypothetical protein